MPTVTRKMPITTYVKLRKHKTVGRAVAARARAYGEGEAGQVWGARFFIGGISRDEHRDDLGETFSLDNAVRADERRRGRVCHREQRTRVPPRPPCLERTVGVAPINK